jgi:hypothetical protein
MKVVNVLFLAVVTITTSTIASANVFLGLTGTTGDDVSFNPTFFPPTLTLGANNCTTNPPVMNPTCVLMGTRTVGGLLLTWSFSQPNAGTGNASPLTYNYTSGTGSGGITVTGNPTLTFDIHDGAGDDARGSYTPIGLTSGDGGNTVDISGTLRLTSFTAGSSVTTFENITGISLSQSSVNGSFDIVVGSCKSGSKSVVCVEDTTDDPSAQVKNASITTPGVTASSAPEPSTLAVSALACAVLLVLRRHRRAS